MKTEPNEPFMFCDALIEDGEEYLQFIGESIKKYKQQQYLGLTKREYFAAMAMQGIISKGGELGDYNKVAYHAVRFADNLIELLNVQ